MSASEGNENTNTPDDSSGSPVTCNYCFALTNNLYWKSWEHWRIPRKSPFYHESKLFKYLSLLTSKLVTGGMPIFFYRCGLTRELFDLIVEFRPSTTSGGIEERIKRDQSLIRYDKL